jgi:hypothetical protein
LNATRWIPTRLAAHLLYALVAVCLGSTCGIALLWHWSSQKAVEHAILILDTSPRDLGVTLPGEKVSFQYNLQNTGGKELVISELHTSCGCSPAHLDTNPVPIGGSAVIGVSFQAPPASGVVGHSVMFHTNDPDQQDIELRFQVLVKRPIEAVPPNIYAGVVMCGASATHDLELCGTDGSPFEVKGIRPSVPWIRVTPLANQSSHRRLFRVAIEDVSNPGAISESVQFLTSCPRQEQVVVPILGEIVAAHRVSPASLLLNSASAGSLVDAKFTINAPSGGEPTIKSVAIKADEWQVSFWKTEKRTDSSLLLRVQLRLPSSTGYKRTALILDGIGGSTTQQIPVSCVVTDALPAND